MALLEDQIKETEDALVAAHEAKDKPNAEVLAAHLKDANLEPTELKRSIIEPLVKTGIFERRTIPFKDLEFNPHPIGGIFARMMFDNGYGVSVVKTPYSYGGDRGKYELAVLNSQGEITYETPITDDVLGYLNENDVTHYMEEVQKILTFKLK